MSNEDSETSFLNRWSTRKRDAAVETTTEVDEAASGSAYFSMPLDEEPGTAALVDTSLSPDDVERSGAKSETSISADEDSDAEELVLTDADMPAIETLTADSNVSPFFNKGVSAALRKAALRYVFQQPKFNVRDGLNDYDGDYTVFEPLGDTITSDMKFHAARKERDRLAAEAELEEERLRQEQLEAEEASNEAEPAEQTETDDDSGTEDQPQADEKPSPETADDSLIEDQPQNDEEPSPENQFESEPTTLALADGDDGMDRQTSMSKIATEQV